MSKKGKILGVAYGGGHANCVLPVLNELSQRRHEVLFLGLTSSIPQGKKSGLPMKTYRDYLHLTDKEMAYELGQPLAEKMHNPNLGIDIDESIYYLGVNLLENRNSLGQELADEAFAKAGRHSFLPVEFLKGILREEKPDILITTNSPKSEKASLVAAEQLNVKSVRIEDLYGIANALQDIKNSMGANLYDQTIARFRFKPSKTCVVCDYTKQILRSTHVDYGYKTYQLEDVVVTGQPAFDSIDKIVNENPRVVLFPDNKKPIVTWSHQNVTPDGKSVFNLIKNWLSKYGCAYKLVIKIHPNMLPNEVADLESYFSFAKEHILIIHRDLDPNILIWNSNIVVAQNSTMLTQAVYMGKPVIVLDPEHIRSNNPFSNIGLAMAVSTETELEACVKSLLNLNSPQYQNFLTGASKMGYAMHGTANISNLCEALLSPR